MLGASTGSGTPFAITPCVRTYCPVSMVERAGMHTVFWLYARLKLMPVAARPSTTGVRAIVPPLQPSESYRCWSVVTKRMLRPIALALADSRSRRAREQHRAREPTFAVLVRAVVLLRRRHVDERLAARILDERDRVPVVLRHVTDQGLVDLAHPEDLAAARLDHLRDGV